jgi:hypothetical protein
MPQREVERMEVGLRSALALAFVTFTSACGIALSSSTLPAPESLEGGGYNAAVSPEAGADGAFGGNDYDASVDAGIAPSSMMGSPLCGVDYKAVCDPDKVACGPACATLAEPGMDAGGSGTGGGGTGAACVDAGSVFACHVDKTVTPTCAVPGTVPEGYGCALSTDCAVGLECMSDVAASMQGVCRRYCCDNGCSSGTPSFCDIEVMYGRSQEVPVCRLVEPCTLFDDKCAQRNETCTIVNQQAGVTSCVVPESQKAGQSCEEHKCAAGLACWGDPGERVCVQLCHWNGSDCPSPLTCQQNAAFSNDNLSQFGVCLP